MGVVFAIMAIAFMVLGILGMALCIVARGKPVEDSANRRLSFRYPLADRVFLSGFVIGSCLLVVVSWMWKPPLDPKHDLDTLFYVSVVFGALLIEKLLWRLDADEDGLTCWSPWRGNHYIAWPELKEVAYVEEGRYFILKSEGFWFRLPTVIPGLTRLLAECEKRLPPEAMRSAYHGYNRISRKLPLPKPAPLRLDLRQEWSDDRLTEG